MSKRKRKKPIASNDPIPTAINPRKTKRHKWIPISLIVFYYVTFGLIADAMGVFSELKKAGKTAYENFRDERFITGILIPEKIQRKYKDIEFWKGTEITYISIAQLREGLVFEPKALIMIGQNVPFRMSLQLIDNRLFVAKEIYDLDKKYVGKVDYENWEIVDGSFIDFSETDTSFEVVDQYNTVVFGLRYRYPNKIMARGYSTEYNSCFLYDNINGMEIMHNYGDCKDFITKNRNFIERTNVKRHRSYFWPITLTIVFILFPFLAKKVLKLFGYGLDLLPLAS